MFPGPLRAVNLKGGKQVCFGPCFGCLAELCGFNWSAVSAVPSYSSSWHLMKYDPRVRFRCFLSILLSDKSHLNLRKRPQHPQIWLQRCLQWLSLGVVLLFLSSPGPWEGFCWMSLLCWDCTGSKDRRRLSYILSVAALCSLKKLCCLRLFMLESTPLVIWKAFPVVISLLWMLEASLCTTAPGNRVSWLFIVLGHCTFFGQLFRWELLVIPCGRAPGWPRSIISMDFIIPTLRHVGSLQQCKEQ